MGKILPRDIDTKISSNNLFGIKYTNNGNYVTDWTTEEIRGQRVKIKDKFQAYGSFAESIYDHGAFLQRNPRYSHLFSKKDSIKWAYGLQ